MRAKWVRWGAGMTAAIIVAASAWAAGPSIWGKNLLRSDDLSSDVLARFAVFNAKPKGAPSLVPDSEIWRGESLSAPSKGNPYRIVVTIFGVAEGAGEVSARVDTAWAIDDSGMRVNPSIRVRKDDVQAGQRVQLVTASGPVSFKEDRSVVPAIAFAGSNNLKIDGMRVEVWAGIGKSTWLQLLQSWSPLLIGVVFLSLAIWWRKR